MVPSTVSPPPIVTESDLAVLRTVFLPSGYRGVYHKQRCKSGLWQARPYSGGRGSTTGGRKGRFGPRVLIGTFRNPRDAARAVVQWWKDHFGEDWVAAYRRRTWNPWWVRRTPDGWELIVRVRGVETVIRPPTGAVFASREDAAAHFAAWAAKKYGEDAWLKLRIAG